MAERAWTLARYSQTQILETGSVERRREPQTPRRPSRGRAELSSGEAGWFWKRGWSHRGVSWVTCSLQSYLSALREWEDGDKFSESINLALTSDSLTFLGANSSWPFHHLVAHLPQEELNFVTDRSSGAHKIKYVVDNGSVHRVSLLLLLKTISITEHLPFQAVCKENVVSSGGSQIQCQRIKWNIVCANLGANSRALGAGDTLPRDGIQDLLVGFLGVSPEVQVPPTLCVWQGYTMGFPSRLSFHSSPIILNTTQGWVSFLYSFLEHLLPQALLGFAKMKTGQPPPRNHSWAGTGEQVCVPADH